jgi:hypothetical protein
MLWDMLLGVSIAFTAGVATSLCNKYVINNDKFCRYKDKVIKGSCCFRRCKIKKKDKEDIDISNSNTN